MIGQPETANETTILWCTDEKSLLNKLTGRIIDLDPDVLIGWNLINFDLRILIKRAEINRVRFNIGRGGEIPKWRALRGETDKGFVWIAGRVSIDGIDALKNRHLQLPQFFPGECLPNVAWARQKSGRRR